MPGWEVADFACPSSHRVSHLIRMARLRRCRTSSCLAAETGIPARCLGRRPESIPNATASGGRTTNFALEAARIGAIHWSSGCPGFDSGCTQPNDDRVEAPVIMRALDPEVVDAVWAAVEPLLPNRPVDDHPLGCHRGRVPDRVCFEGILIRLVTGCAWVDVERLMGKRVSGTTLRDRLD